MVTKHAMGQLADRLDGGHGLRAPGRPTKGNVGPIVPDGLKMVDNGG
jgi:hypothetical protein